MIIVWGAIRVPPENHAAAVALGLEHVRRSRTEPGCMHHSLQVCTEDPQRLVFYEEWADQAALDAHFAVPESGAFVRDLAALASSPPEMKLFHATAVDAGAP